MKKIVLIIQARMGSTRLPGKSMMDLAGAPLVGRIIERVSRVRNIDQIVLATSELPKDDILIHLADRYNICHFRGSENDLVDRYFHAANKFEAEIILRLPADNPCPEPIEYDKLIDYHISEEKDFSSNICCFMGNGYPDGIGVEAFTYSALKSIWESERDPFKREHIGTNFYDYLNDKIPKSSPFSVGTIMCPPEYSRPDIILDINTREDFEFIEKLYQDVYPENENFSIKDVVTWYDYNYQKGKNNEEK